ncbi:MAG TPA: N-acyl homoserine lactonase family protein [Vicinamibacterales bacterium]|jgi:glyoxylase-like metal-dependent hydrolase (beta-lactamase superfamily II)|nr:N-acyl homoserine lactonase family protein [Vicinamibacterales bacterium]
MKRLSVALVILTLAWVATPLAQKRPAPPKAPRLYVFDNGGISGLDPKIFGFAREELKSVDFVNQSYLIVHPRGTVMFDTGGIGDDKFPPGGGAAKEGIMTADKKLVPQMEAAGYTPSDVTYLVMSHYHSDHTGNANLFAGATWIVQKAERDVMFADKPEGIIQPATYSALKTAKTKILNNEDFDIFGDGTVMVKTTPGHTPGHQVLFVKLARTGPVLLAGDLYHYPEEITTGKTPTFEFDAAMSAKSRAAVQAFVKQTGAKLWIEHDKPTHANLPKSPRYLD